MAAYNTLPASLQQAMTPRPLTRLELWTGWNTKLVPHHTIQEYEERVLPSWAVLDPDYLEYNSTRTEATPIVYPQLRVSYYPLGGMAHHLAQVARASVLGAVAQAYIFDVGSTDKQKEERAAEFLRDWVWDRFDKPPLGEKLVVAAKYKEEGNDACEKGDWVSALHLYAKAWSTLLPYHKNALATDDPARAALIKLQSTIFINLMAACLIGLNKAPSLTRVEKEELCVIGIKSFGFPYKNWEEGLTVGLMCKACYRLSALQVHLQKTNARHPAILDQTSFTALKTTFEQLATWDQKARIKENDLKPLINCWGHIVGNMLEKAGQDEGKKWMIGMD